jgi:Mg-chelatase subunit ChlD
LELNMTLPAWHSPLALALCGLALAAALQPEPATAREWLSPSPRPAPTPQDEAQQPSTAWSGMLWAGPQAGAPAAPSAGHCRRPPASLAVEGPPGVRRPVGRSFERAAPAVAADEMRGHAESLAKGSATEVPLAAAPMPAPMAAAAPGASAERAPSTPLTPRRRPADEPVAAGVVDDNADFGEYLAFRARNAQRLPRSLEVAERVRLEVRDARGRPVPDAAVAVYAAGRAQPLWARTDAAGRTWLMPQADMDGSVFEVQISKGGESTRVLWQRGQKDALQARLSASPPARAQLDVAFLIDATGSMADEIDKLKRSMRSIADQIAQLPSRPDLCFALVAYRDRGDEFFIRGADFSHDLGAFQSTLAQLQAGGGGDYPEALSEALHTAVHRLSWRCEGTARLVLLVADAPPHLDRGAPHFDEDLRGALGRGIKLLAVGASGLDATGETALRQAAQFTGGRFVFLTYADARNPASGPGRETVHDVRNYSVQSLDALVVRLVTDEMAAWPEKP